MNALVPELLNKNKVERQSLWYPAPVLFVQLSYELTEAHDDNKHTINVRINNEIKEQVSVVYGGVPDAYLQYCKLCESLVCKTNPYNMFDR